MGIWIKQNGSPANVECYARGKIDPLVRRPIKSSRLHRVEKYSPVTRAVVWSMLSPIVDLCAGDPLAHAIPPSSEGNGILLCPDLHLPCYSKATSVPVEPSPGSMAAVQGLLACNQSAEEHAGLANRPLSSPVPGTGRSIDRNVALALLLHGADADWKQFESIADLVASLPVAQVGCVADLDEAYLPVYWRMPFCPVLKLGLGVQPVN
ncbi:hypothetical protein Nepgr_013493 [Nepenthes gracilis]|uniref:Uncharacterized protein n=1 Tax=Nepenthes gracilis TaxID=150966 RepID=A0AAD3XNQ5_NEPGR|nr:hypothetical protein Nepgr_013493 [Nepenthes gracilis]